MTTSGASEGTIECLTRKTDEMSKLLNNECKYKNTKERSKRIKTDCFTNICLPCEQEQAETTDENYERKKRAKTTENSAKSNKKIIEYANPFFNTDLRTNKKPKNLHYSTKIIVKVKDCHGNVVPI